MAPADRYSIYLVDFQDGESNDQRTITYSKENGVGEIDGWYIHLRVEPLHADGQGYHGYGSEVIDLYYGDGNLSDNLPIFGGELHLGLNAEIIEIDYAYEIMAVKDIDENANVFGDRCLIDCSWASARYNLMYVDYSQYNNIQTIGFEDFQVGDQVIIGLYDNQKQTAYNGTAVAEQVQLATQRLNTHTQMQPTETNLRGFYGGYLFTNFNGATYRYALTEANPQRVTADQLLLTFSEETQIEGIAWEVYSLKEYPDGSKVLAISGTNSAWLCEYVPAQRAEEGALEAARAAGYVIEEDCILTDGQDAWHEFYEKTQRGEQASIRVAHYLTLDPDRTVATTYEAYKQDYPSLFVDELTYDGEKFILRTESKVTVYEYLMRCDISGTPLAGHTEHKQVIRYVLTHDPSHTYEELFASLASSALGAAIPHYTILTEQSPT